MNVNEYQILASRTINRAADSVDQEYHALHGMVGEIGELLWFIAEYCTACGWTLEEVMGLNIDKLKKRYPEGFDSEKSLHRQEGDV